MEREKNQMGVEGGRESRKRERVEGRESRKRESR